MKDLDIQVGDIVTYKDGSMKIITSKNKFGRQFDNYGKLIEKENIVKLERPKYEVIEEKEKLLTEEEREFLRQYIALSFHRIDALTKTENTLLFYNDNIYDAVSNYEVKKDMFKNINNRIYTLSELGLEE